VVASQATASSIRIFDAQFGVDTTITVQNTGGSAVDLTGWKLRVGTGSVTLPAAARVGPGEMLTIHVTSGGASTGRDIYLGQEARPLLHSILPGANIAVLDGSNNVVAESTLPRP
jgi:hypothetical protein